MVIDSLSIERFQLLYADINWPESMGKPEKLIRVSIQDTLTWEILDCETVLCKNKNDLKNIARKISSEFKELW